MFDKTPAQSLYCYREWQQDFAMLSKKVEFGKEYRPFSRTEVSSAQINLAY